MDTYSPLAHDTAGNGEWDEWVAAMYESYAADWEAAQTRMGRHETPEIGLALDSYAGTAHALAERIEDETYEKIMNEEEWEPFNPDATHPY